MQYGLLRRIAPVWLKRNDSIAITLWWWGAMEWKVLEARQRSGPEVQCPNNKFWILFPIKLQVCYSKVLSMNDCRSGPLPFPYWNSQLVSLSRMKCCMIISGSAENPQMKSEQLISFAGFLLNQSLWECNCTSCTMYSFLSQYPLEFIFWHKYKLTLFKLCPLFLIW